MNIGVLLVSYQAFETAIDDFKTRFATLIQQLATTDVATADSNYKALDTEVNEYLQNSFDITDNFFYRDYSQVCLGFLGETIEIIRNRCVAKKERLNQILRWVFISDIAQARCTHTALQNSLETVSQKMEFILDKLYDLEKIEPSNYFEIDTDIFKPNVIEISPLEKSEMI